MMPNASKGLRIPADGKAGVMKIYVYFVLPPFPYPDTQKEMHCDKAGIKSIAILNLFSIEIA